MLQNAIASTVTAPFDEQLQFLNAEGQPYAEVRYLLHLANGETAQGQTDVQGRTARIATNEPTSITRADLYYAVDTCCARHAEESKQSEASQIVELQGVETNGTYLSCFPRKRHSGCCAAESRNPGFHGGCWIPAFAGMTENLGRLLK